MKYWEAAQLSNFASLSLNSGPASTMIFMYEFMLQVLEMNVLNNFLELSNELRTVPWSWFQ